MVSQVKRVALDYQEMMDCQERKVFQVSLDSKVVMD